MAQSTSNDRLTWGQRRAIKRHQKRQAKLAKMSQFGYQPPFIAWLLKHALAVFWTLALIQGGNVMIDVAVHASPRTTDTWRLDWCGRCAVSGGVRNHQQRGTEDGRQWMT